VKRLPCLLIVLGTLGITAAGGNAAPIRSDLLARLRLVSPQPVVLAGSGFRGHERVRLSVTAGTETATSYRTATLAGTFRATFVRLSVGRCDTMRAIAIGGSGTHAVFKRLPSPACIAERSPG
jgi:hypothetical protein